MESFVRREVLPGPKAIIDENLFDYGCRNAKTDHRPVGTCRMGIDGRAVVGPDLKVRGIEGLRVCDDSAMPFVPSCNTSAPTIMVGEKGADLIRERPPLAPVVSRATRRTAMAVRMVDDRAFLVRLFEAAVAAADPRLGIGANLPPAPKGRTIVLGAGKGSGEMALAFEEAWRAAGRRIDDGLVVVRHGTHVEVSGVAVVEAAHPVPDEASFEAARRMLALAEGAGEDDLVVALISGGGSALLSVPPAGIDAEEKRRINRQLLDCGASIHEMNAVRKHFSRVKGGRLAAAAHPARVATFVVSDIPGDDVSIVASGPTIPSGATRADALAIVRRYGLDLSPAARAHLESLGADAPRPGGAFAGDAVVTLATARRSLEAAAAVSRAEGVPAFVLSDRIEGEARDIGRMHGALARETIERALFPRPCLLLSGGETTVTIRARNGRGGRNTEFLLGLAEAIDGLSGIAALAADTDGIDGSENNAGAFCDGATAQALRRLGTPLAGFMAANDAYSAFEALGALFAPGPTGTNVNDFRAILLR